MTSTGADCDPADKLNARDPDDGPFERASGAVSVPDLRAVVLLKGPPFRFVGPLCLVNIVRSSLR